MKCNVWIKSLNITVKDVDFRFDSEIKPSTGYGFGGQAVIMKKTKVNDKDEIESSICERIVEAKIESIEAGCIIVVGRKILRETKFTLKFNKAEEIWRVYPIG